ncbi:MAG TPA: YraN family protein [Candidatus Manganitrophaceae bacterium]|nr:YraN family protein [Candidatus Manganitrophaceae bacterium]
MTGAEGEEIAAAFLLKRGYRILERNYRTALGELDIIAKEGKTLVFVEVKARSGDYFGAPQFAVDFRKQAKMSRVALAYLSRKKLLPCACRFDVVGVLKSPQGTRVELFQNAFDVIESRAGC